MLELNKIHPGSALKVLKKIPDNSVDCCVTSTPYYGLRDYGTGKWVGGSPDCQHRFNTKNANPDWRIQTRGKIDNGVGSELMKDVCKKCGAKRVDEQIGLEETPEQFIKKLVKVFSEIKRVLKDDGTLWLNIGDSYAAYWGHKYGQGQSLSGSRENNGSAPPSKKSPAFTKHIKPKDLFGIPWTLAFALRKDGWFLRQDIIWAKPNPMPESVTDRCTKSHEYIFLLSKSAKYYYDQEAIRLPLADSTILRALQNIQAQKGSDRVPGKTNGTMKAVIKRTVRKGIDTHGGQGKGQITMAIHGTGLQNHSGYHDEKGNLLGTGTANKKSVWTVATKPFKEAHFATFPEELIIDCIKAGCPGGGYSIRSFYGCRYNSSRCKKAEQKFHWNRIERKIYNDSKQKAA